MFALLTRSDDLPLAKAESPNLDLDPEPERFALGGGGGKFIGASLRLRMDRGDMTVMALAGLATSCPKIEVFLRLAVCRSGGERGPVRPCALGVYGGGGESRGPIHN